MEPAKYDESEALSLFDRFNERQGQSNRDEWHGAAMHLVQQFKLLAERMGLATNLSKPESLQVWLKKNDVISATVVVTGGKIIVHRGHDQPMPPRVEVPIRFSTAKGAFEGSMAPSPSPKFLGHVEPRSALAVLTEAVLATMDAKETAGAKAGT